MDAWGERICVHTTTSSNSPNLLPAKLSLALLQGLMPPICYVNRRKKVCWQFSCNHRETFSWFPQPQKLPAWNQCHGAIRHSKVDSCFCHRNTSNRFFPVRILLHRAHFAGSVLQTSFTPRIEISCWLSFEDRRWIVFKVLIKDHKVKASHDSFLAVTTLMVADPLQFESGHKNLNAAGNPCFSPSIRKLNSEVNMKRRLCYRSVLTICLLLHGWTDSLYSTLPHWLDRKRVSSYLRNLIHLEWALAR